MSLEVVSTRAMSESDEVAQNPDSTLMSRLQNGDANAMNDMVCRFGPGLNRLVGRLTGWSALQLKELAAAADVTRLLRRFRREIDRLMGRMDIQVRRYDQVSMETEEEKLLLRQIVDATKDRDQPGKP